MWVNVGPMLSLMPSLLSLALLAVEPPSLQALATPAGGTVGFAALDLASGRTLG